MTRFPRLRPRLRIRSRLSPEQVVDRLSRTLQGGAFDLTGTFSGRYVVLRVGEVRQHFGSPQLSFEVEPSGSGSALSGLFMPMPSIWTAFMALYGSVVFLGFCGIVYGYAQTQIGETPTAFWAVPLALLLVCLVYAAASVGQRMGQAQMEELKHFVRESLADLPERLSSSSDAPHESAARSSGSISG